MKKKIFLALIFVVLLSTYSLADSTYKVMYSEEIPPALTETIKSYNQLIFTGIKATDASLIGNILADEWKDQGVDKFQDFFAYINQSLQSHDFLPVNAYYLEPDPLTDPVNEPELINVEVAPKNDEPYTLKTQIGRVPTYLALFQTNNGGAEYMLSVIYIKENDQWKLQLIHWGLYKLAGKTAIEWYKESRAHFSQEEDLPAMLKLSVAYTLSRPTPFFEYNLQKELSAFVDTMKMLTSQRYTFPKTLETLPSKPAIFSIEPKIVGQELFPLIKYVTKTSIDDPAALEAEAALMAKELESLFPGITTVGSHIMFTAFSEPPINPTMTYRAFTSTVKVQ